MIHSKLLAPVFRKVHRPQGLLTSTERHYIQSTNFVIKRANRIERENDHPHLAAWANPGSTQKPNNRIKAKS
jgi:hypothetical protein